MSATYGIAGFVDGFVRGREVKNSWEDRKLDRERQKRLDDLTFARDKRDAEEHGARMGALRRQEADWIRENNQRQSWEDANKAAVEAANAAMNADQGGQPPSTSTSSSSGTPGPNADAAAQIGQNLGLPVQSLAGSMATAIDANGGIAPTQSLGAVARPTPDPAAVSGDAGNPVPVSPSPSVHPADPSRGRRVFINGMGDVILHQNGTVYDVGTGQQITDPMMVKIVRDAAVSSSRPPVVDPLGIMPDYKHDWGASLAGDAAEAGRRGLAGLGAVEGGVADIARRGVQQAANAVNGAINPVAQYVTGGAVPEVPVFTGNGWEAKPPSQIAAEQSKETLGAGLNDLSQTWKSATGGPKAPGAPLASNAKPGASASETALAETATDAMAGTATPAMQAATAAAQSDPKNTAKGVRPSAKTTEDQRGRAAKSFMDYYREVGAPIVMEDMLKRGDLKGAQAFQEYLDQSETKAGMESWAKAAFAANMGDMDTFASEIINAYNRLDYFPDGTTIVESQSGFTYGRDGEISGAKLTFKDEKTGNTFEQVFSDPSDLVKLGITMLAPEEAFKHYSDQVANAAEPNKAAQDRQDNFDKRVDSAAKIIMESSKGLDGIPTKSYADARKEAEAAISGLGTVAPGAGPAGSPPVMYRP